MAVRVLIALTWNRLARFFNNRKGGVVDWHPQKACSMLFSLAATVSLIIRNGYARYMILDCSTADVVVLVVLQ
jgi:hypothetical protein